MKRTLTIAALAGAFLLGAPERPAAHEIPAHVTVMMFVKPEGQRLRVLVRVPLEAMRDVELFQRGPGYLDLARIDPLLRTAATQWLADYLEFDEDGTPLGDPELRAAIVSLPSDRSFTSYAEAMAHVTGPPLAVTTDLPWKQAMLDVLLDYPVRSDSSRFSVHPGLAHLGLKTSTVLRFLPPGGSERAFQYLGDPGVVRLDPRWHQATLRFVSLGFSHIMDGIDHLLFVLCLVIPFRRFGPLLAIVTSFTVAHSITLIASAQGMAPDALWFPPLIETLIALSIVYMAFENIVGPKIKRRWIIAFGFGLVHGFGFSFILRESLQFAGAHLLTSLLSFNVGVELGQIAVLVVAVPLLSLLFRYVVAERAGTILLSALIAHSAWHWMTERASALRQYDFQWPAFDLAFFASALRGLMLLLIVAGAIWALYGLVGRLMRTEKPGSGIRDPVS